MIGGTYDPQLTDEAKQTRDLIDFIHTWLAVVLRILNTQHKRNNTILIITRSLFLSRPARVFVCSWVNWVKVLVKEEVRVDPWGRPEGRSVRRRRQKKSAILSEWLYFYCVYVLFKIVPVLLPVTHSWRTNSCCVGLHVFFLLLSFKLCTIAKFEIDLTISLWCMNY